MQFLVVGSIFQRLVAGFAIPVTRSKYLGFSYILIKYYSIRKLKRLLFRHFWVPSKLDGTKNSAEESGANGLKSPKPGFGTVKSFIPEKGLIYMCDIKGQPLMDTTVTAENKLWWPMSEALYATILAYETAKV